MKPRIFFSSVSKELKSVRQRVANTLVALGYEPVWQDVFETSGEDIRPMLRRTIDSCSAVLQIVGDAFGADAPRAGNYHCVAGQGSSKFAYRGRELSVAARRD